jgi:hypothetical protein
MTWPTVAIPPIVPILRIGCGDYSTSGVTRESHSRMLLIASRAAAPNRRAGSLLVGSDSPNRKQDP